MHFCCALVLGFWTVSFRQHCFQIVSGHFIYRFIGTDLRQIVTMCGIALDRCDAANHVGEGDERGIR